MPVKVTTQARHKNKTELKGVVISLLQRVTGAKVTVDDAVSGEIGCGLLVFTAIQPDDDVTKVSRMAERVLTYRVFPDSEDRMNHSLLDKNLALLIVPQFTLAADTAKGTRASFAKAAPPKQGIELFEQFVLKCRQSATQVETGVFGASMQVSLVNDGPVTFWLEV